MLSEDPYVLPVLLRSPRLFKVFVSMLFRPFVTIHNEDLYDIFPVKEFDKSVFVKEKNTDGIEKNNG